MILRFLLVVYVFASAMEGKKLYFVPYNIEDFGAVSNIFTADQAVQNGLNLKLKNIS